MSDSLTPTARPRVLLIGGKPAHVRKALELGLDVVLAQYPDAYENDHWPPGVEKVLRLDYGDLDQLVPLVRELHEQRPFAAAVSLFELGLLPAARVSEELGLGGESVATVELLLDKGRMRRLLEAKGISPVASAVGRSARDVRAFVAVHGLPVIVKPVRESGSLGVLRIDDEAGVEAAADRYRSIDDGHWNPGDLAFADSFDEFLMEEYLDGPEISVETLSSAGRHVIIAVTDKEIGGAGFVETGHSQPSRHPAAALREAARLVTDFLDAVGLRNGPGHTEVKLTSRGPRIVESHNRVGGDRINELTEITTGVDMERHALAAGLGLLQPPATSPSPRGGAAIRFLTPEPGRVAEVTGSDAVRADPVFVELQLKAGPGTVIPPLTWNEEKTGHVIARGATATEALTNAGRLAAAIRIRTEPVA
ncbi:ATP-grasp domain-containing protein [Streptomyces boninensis]|uniref:ATP-grasp domain-containing protein n=1 Tax=Streptomyces boninensis TaxID=2039455 RepID=UPI003B2195B1